LRILAWMSDVGGLGDEIPRPYAVSFECKGINVIVTVINCTGFGNVTSHSQSPKRRRQT
jgi:hypothetical protein